MKHYIAVLTPDEASIRVLLDLLDVHEVVICASFEEARECCRQHNVLLVIVDELSGSGIFADLRRQWPWLTGLLLTAKQESDALPGALQAGYSGLLAKPLVPGRQREAVRQAMETAILREENTRLRTLLPLYSLSEQLLLARSEPEVLDCLLDMVVSQTQAKHVSIMLYDEREQCLRIAAARGLDKDLLSTIRVQPGDRISGWVFQQGRPVILNRDSQGDSVLAPLLKRPEIVTAISFPLMRRDHILGVLNISQTSGESYFSEADREMLAVICSQAVLALQNARSIRAVKEKTRERALLEQYVAPEVAELLLAQESNLEDVGDIREVTVLFADIRNFTSLVQHLPLEQLRTFLNEFFSLFTDTIFRHHGTVDKFMGDAVLAIFGAPVHLESSCQAACQAALGLRNDFERLRARWAGRREDFSRVDLGMGLTYGQMFVGNVGSLSRLDYTVIGTQVNVAQRMAAESTACEIYLTEQVRDNLDGSFTLISRGPVKLRGMEQALTLFSLEG